MPGLHLISTSKSCTSETCSHCSTSSSTESMMQTNTSSTESMMQNSSSKSIHSSQPQRTTQRTSTSTELLRHSKISSHEDYIIQVTRLEITSLFKNFNEQLK